MEIIFNTDALKPMTDWLLERKNTGKCDEGKLRKILALPDYKVELERYEDPNLPVCGISLDEAVDFFMNFDRKDFENPRLQYKKESFINFYNNIEKRLEKIESFTKLKEKDFKVVEELLKNGLPDEVLAELPKLNVILIVSIGNSMGWPYDHYIDYDVANLDSFNTVEDFLHVTAHEIHHILFAGLLAPEGIKGEEFFLQNFSFEGLAVHYNNNLATKGKPKKYDDITYVMQDDDMAFYEEHFDEIFEMIRTDYYACIGKTIEEVSEIVSEHYEQFEFMGKKIQQYPTYYFGCYMWGLVDLTYGKEKMFEAVKKPEMFVKLYNQAAEERYRF